MYTQEIQPDQWPMFFNDFSRQHHGESVVVEVLDPDLGRQDIATNQPLIGITADPKDTLGELIEIMVGEAPPANVNHDIPRPTRVYLARTDDGHDAALAIESADEPKTIVRFGGVEWPEIYGT